MKTIKRWLIRIAVVIGFVLFFVMVFTLIRLTMRTVESDTLFKARSEKIEVEQEAIEKNQQMLKKTFIMET